MNCGLIEPADVIGEYQQDVRLVRGHQDPSLELVVADAAKRRATNG
jgi:hypothetical protein